jgi:hypothetical protein
VEDLVVLVVDDDEPSRTRLLFHLRQLGLRALGVDRVADALALLEALSADATLVYEEAPALESLRGRCLVLPLRREDPVGRTLARLLLALSEPEATVALN